MKSHVWRESACRDNVADPGLVGLAHGSFDVPDAIQRHIRTVGKVQPLAVHQSPRKLEFLSALIADLVGPILDREHTTHLAVMTPQGKLEKP
jgi:hypothetical protein